MIKIEKTQVYGWEAAIRGMRNPMNSWDKSDSTFEPDVCIGPNDHALAMSLAKAGSDHRKYMRQIFVSVDVTAPLYWWKEYDTYKVGTVANSCSTMHKVHAKEFTLEDFSCEYLTDGSLDILSRLIYHINAHRDEFVDTGDKSDWWQIIQLLPSSYNQLRTLTLNYEVLRNMYTARRSHKLDEWRAFCRWIEKLPYSELITLQEGAEE